LPWTESARDRKTPKCYHGDESPPLSEALGRLCNFLRRKKIAICFTVPRVYTGCTACKTLAFSAFILCAALLSGRGIDYSSDCTSLFYDITCERNASVGDLEGLCRLEKDLLGSYVAQRRSIRRLCRLERILGVLPSGNSLLSAGVRRWRRSAARWIAGTCFYCNNTDVTVCNTFALWRKKDKKSKLTTKINPNRFGDNISKTFSQQSNTYLNDTENWNSFVQYFGAFHYSFKYFTEYWDQCL